MPVYLVPVTIVEYGRIVRVEADTPQQARAKVRDGRRWVDATDPERCVVTVVGPTERED